jgi:hypothetical protein
MQRIRWQWLAAAAVTTLTVPVFAADHLDAPGLTSPGGDSRLDINDIFVFQSPADASRVAFVVTVSPAAGVLGETAFHPGAIYALRIDQDGDGKEDEVFRVTFSAPDGLGEQQLRVRPAKPGRDGRGATDEDVALPGGGLFRAGLFDDPFFFDLHAFLGTNGRSFCDGGQENFFLGLNTLAMVLELPRASFTADRLGVWATTELDGDQVDRMGRPAINTVFIPNNPFEPAGSEASQKSFFNAGKPKHDPRDFRTEVVDTLEIFYGAGHPTAQALADVLLPDVLTVDASSSAGFLNGRRLADDVIDVELALVTNGVVSSDCVASDSAFLAEFPYLAPAN